jgi:hypothetical protein
MLAAVLLAATWDGLYDALDLPKPSPALFAQLGGAALAALAYLLGSAAGRVELAAPAAIAGSIAQGLGALIIAAWLLFRTPRADLEIGTLGTVLLIVTAVVLAALAIGLARSAGEPGPVRE